MDKRMVRATVHLCKNSHIFHTDGPVNQRRSHKLISVIMGVLWISSCVPARVPGPTLVSIENTPSIVTLAPLPTDESPTNAPSRDEKLEISPLDRDKIGLYEMLEVQIQTSVTTENPFDPNQLELTVAFTSPTGKRVEIGAFWYQKFDYQTKQFTGEGSWKARFTPTETGTWNVVARIKTLGLESSTTRFDVIQSSKTGFVRVNHANPRYFSFDDGSFFFPIGINMAWWSGAGDALTDYKKWMDLFASNGGNTIRVWMAEWSFGIEWNNTPLGDYSQRLQRAWLLDQIFAMAEERGIYIILVLYNCADFNDWQTNGWAGNPYNAINGGPLEKPDQFVTDPVARALTQRRITYIVNRWGYSPNLLAWEWWNEVNLAPFSDATLIPWLLEMTTFLREHDVNRHLVTNSYAIRDISPIWDLPEMDIIQKHEYANQVNSKMKDLADRVATDLSKLAASAPPKPILLGEFGYSTEGTDREIDTGGIHLHNGIWGTTFAGYAGSGMFWYWDTYLERNQVWYHFRGLERFLEEIDLPRYEPFSPLEISGLSAESDAVIGMGLRGSNILIWLRSNAYTVQACEESWRLAGSQGSYYYLPPLIQDQTLIIRDVPDGDYTITWYNPQDGTWKDPVALSSKANLLHIEIPDFRQDLAARISLIEQ